MALLTQKAMVSGLHHPSAPHAGHKKHRRFSLVRRLQFHCCSSRTVRRNHLGCLVSTSGRSQISAVHFSSPLLNLAASSQPGDTPTMKQLTADQLSVSAWLHTTVPGFTSDLLQVLLNYLVARTQGKTCRRPLLPLHFAIQGFHKAGKHVQKPKLSHCNLQLHRVLWHLAMANMVAFAPNEQRSPCGFAMRQPTAGGGSRPNTPQQPSQADRPHLPFWKLLGCQADYLGQHMWQGSANPARSGGGVLPDWCTQMHWLLLPLAWAGGCEVFLR